MKSIQSILEHGIDNPDFKILVVYHASDFDGWLSCAVAANTIREYYPKAKVVSLPYNYFKHDVSSFAEYLSKNSMYVNEEYQLYSNVNDKLIFNFDMVICGDITLPIDVIDSMMEQGIFVIMGDHHKTAIETLKEHDYVPEYCYNQLNEHHWVTYISYRKPFSMCISNNRISGAYCLYIALENLWCVLYDKPEDKLNAKHKPLGLVLCSIYDTHQVESPLWHDALELNAYAHYLNSLAVDTKGELEFAKFAQDCLTKKLDDDLIYDDDNIHELLGEYLTKGKMLLEAKAAQDKVFAKTYSFPLTFEGIKFLAINTQGNSKVLDGVYDPGVYEAKMMFMYNPKADKWVVSTFGDDVHDIDLSAIAKKYGGGGHKQACGFSVTALPFNLPN